MRERISELIERFEENRLATRTELESLSARDPEGFYNASISVLREGVESAGRRHLARILVKNYRLVEALCDPAAFTLEEAVDLGRKVALVEPRIDQLLIDLFSSARPSARTAGGGPDHIRLLEVLGAVTKGRRLTYFVRGLTGHSDPRIRSKAVLLLGRVAPNPLSTEKLIGSDDARVRANAVESLWQSPSGPAGRLLRLAIQDKDNRVFGNAAYGLHSMGAPDAALHLLSAARDERSKFRLTAAWVMGKTGDPRFIPTLEELLADPDERVRARAARSLIDVRRNIRRSVDAGQFNLLPAMAGKDNQRARLVLRAEKAGGELVSGLLGTQFILWASGRLVTDYVLKERRRPASMGVAFGVCQENSVEGFVDAARRGITRCLERKGAADLWAVAKLQRSPEAPIPFSWQSAMDLSRAESAEEIGFHRDTVMVERSVAQPPTPTVMQPVLCEVLRRILSSAARYKTRHQIILVAQPASVTSPEVASLAKSAQALRAVIHGVVAGGEHAGIADACTMTGGELVHVPSIDQVESAVERLYLSLLDCYELQWAVSEPPCNRLRLEVFAEHGHGECEVEL